MVLGVAERRSVSRRSRGVSSKPRPVVCPLILAAIACGTSLVGAQDSSHRELGQGEWREYAGDTYGMKYSPLSQITTGNIDDLRVAWRWPSADRALQRTDPVLRASRYEDTPLMANGTLYTVTPLGLVAALDPGTGDTHWVYDPMSYEAGRHGNAGFMVRGLAYWTDGTRERLLLGTNDAYVISVDAWTGEPDPAFGDRGRVDLTTGIRGAIRTVNFSGRRALVAGDVVIVGSSVLDNVRNVEAPPGYVQAFDVRTGELLWTFHTVPREFEAGYETWLNGSAAYTGHTNVWAGMAYDPELDYVYLPTSTPTNDYYGGHRPGDNLYAESLVCVEAKTGRRVWHFQAIHHGLWDYDFPTHPTLGDITVDGKRIKAVMQVSKQNFTYVFDRETGEPVWPIEERPVPRSTVPGERTSPTQPFPTKPPAYDLQGSTEDNIIDFTPELKQLALEQLQGVVSGPLYTPPSEQGTLAIPSQLGGANWGGAGFDPEAGVLYVPSRTTATIMRLIPGDPTQTNFRYRSGGGGHLTSLLTVEGLPLFKPPYARLTAIDMNTGEHLWMTPLGNGPRSHPLLRDLNLPPLGDPILGGSVLVTKTLLFVSVTHLFVFGHPQPVPWAEWTDPDVERKLIYVLDKDSGNILRVIDLEGLSAAAPMTYMHEGKQYVVVAVGGGEDSELVALSLP